MALTIRESQYQGTFGLMLPVEDTYKKSTKEFLLKVHFQRIFLLLPGRTVAGSQPFASADISGCSIAKSLTPLFAIEEGISKTYLRSKTEVA